MFLTTYINVKEGLKLKIVFCWKYEDGKVTFWAKALGQRETSSEIQTEW